MLAGNAVGPHASAYRAAGDHAAPARAAARSRFEVVVVVALVDHVAPAGVGATVGLTHASRVIAVGQMQRRRVRNRHPRVAAVERQAPCRTCPLAVQVAFAIVPVLPFPDASATVVPDPHQTHTPPPNPGSRPGFRPGQ